MWPICPIVTRFSKSDPFFQFLHFFPCLTLFSQCDAFFQVSSFFKCVPFFRSEFNFFKRHIFPIVALFSKYYPFFSKCDPSFLCPIFLSLTHSFKYDRWYIFPSVSYFYKCDPFFQVCPIFLCFTHFTLLLLLLLFRRSQTKIYNLYNQTRYLSWIQAQLSIAWLSLFCWLFSAWLYLWAWSITRGIKECRNVDTRSKVLP